MREVCQAITNNCEAGGRVWRVWCGNIGMSLGAMEPFFILGWVSFRGEGLGNATAMKATPSQWLWGLCLFNSKKEMNGKGWVLERSNYRNFKRKKERELLYSKKPGVGRLRVSLPVTGRTWWADPCCQGALASVWAPGQESSFLGRDKEKTFLATVSLAMEEAKTFKTEVS